MNSLARLGSRSTGRHRERLSASTERPHKSPEGTVPVSDDGPVSFLRCRHATLLLGDTSSANESATKARQRHRAICTGERCGFRLSAQPRAERWRKEAVSGAFERLGMRSQNTAKSNSCLAGGPGFEPRLPGSEPGVLPLNYPPTSRPGHYHAAADGRNVPDRQGRVEIGLAATHLERG